MRTLKKILTILGAFALTFSALPGSAAVVIDTRYVEGTDPASIMYNPMVVNRFNLEMPQSTIDGLNGSTNNWDVEGPYLPAKLSGTVNGVAFGPLQVGVHLKGAWGSWRNIYGKAGFKVKINFVDKNLRLYGVDKLTLNNMVQDHSSLHETMSYRLFRALGVPTARTGYANVYVNGQNYGLHLNLETVGSTLLSHWGITPNHIYKGGVPNFPDLYPGQEGAYAIDQGSAADVSDLTGLMAVVGRGNGPNWFRDISTKVDLEEMTLDWAAEKFTGHWDGYVNNHNNFYLVNRQDNKFIMLPWGMDQTWNGALNYFDGAALISQCINDVECLKIYKASLVKVIHTAKELDLPQMSRDVATVINPSLLADPKKEFGNNEIPGVQAPSRTFITNQISSGLGMIAPYDTTLRMFGTSGGESAKPNQQLVVPNETTSVHLVGTAYSTYATVAEIGTIALNPGVNKVPVTVTNRNSGTSRTYIVQVYRKLKGTKSVALVFVKGKPNLTATSLKSLNATAKAVFNGSKRSLSVRMQTPAGMSVKAATNLLKSRSTVLTKAFLNAGVDFEKITLVIGPVKGAETLSVSVGYQY